MPAKGRAIRQGPVPVLFKMEIYDEIWRLRGSRRIMNSMPVSLNRPRLASAAFRLKHDVGKAVRWSAPAVGEPDPEALRRRLEIDLVGTRAIRDFDAWMSEDAPLFRFVPGWMDRITRMSEAIESIRASLPHLGLLDRKGLDALDEATAILAQESRALWRDVISKTAEDSPQ